MFWWILCRIILMLQLMKASFYSDSCASIYVDISRHQKLPVAIIGGGLGGMALTLALQRKGIDVKVFEKDPSFLYRRQGYGLTLQQGITPLRILGFRYLTGGLITTSHISYSSNGELLGVYGHKKENISTRSIQTEQQILLQSNNNVDLNRKNLLDLSHLTYGVNIIKCGRHNVHIPRQTLRQLLLNEIQTPENVIHWSEKLVCYEDSCSDEGVTLYFDDNSTMKCSVLVAADGIYSNIRKLKFPFQSLEYLGLVVILGISRKLEAENEPRFVKQWVDGNSRVFSMPYDDHHSMWQMSFPLEEQAAIDLSYNPATLKAEAIRRCGHWNNDLSRLLHDTEESLISGHPVYDRTPLTEFDINNGESTNISSRVTMIGDAAHPMSPFKGQGANQALLDATALASALAFSNLTKDRYRNVDVALRSFETEMMSRSTPKVLKSRIAAKLLHSAAALAPGDMTRAFIANNASSDTVTI